MIVGTFKKSYIIKNRTRTKNIITIRQGNDLFDKCYEFVQREYDDISLLLDLMEVNIDKIPEGKDKRAAIKALKKVINNKIAIAEEELSKLIILYKITDEEDRSELEDAITQLQEREEAVLSSYS